MQRLSKPFRILQEEDTIKIIFLMPAGTIEWEVPPEQIETFNFSAFVANVRCNGFFTAPGIYIRHDAMIGIVNDPSVLKQPVFSQGGTLQ